MFRRRLLLFLLSAVAVADPACADELTHELAYANGKRAMDLGRYEEALALFRKAVALSPKEALYHFNVAEALEALGKDRAAYKAFKAVVALEGVPAALAERAKSKALAIKVRHRKRKAQAKDSDRKAPPAPATGAQSGGPGPWPWVLVGGGAAVLAVGVTLLVLGEHDRQEVNNASREEGVITGLTQAEAAELWSTGSMKANAGAALMGIGGAAVLGGLGWLILSKPGRTASGPPRLRLGIIGDAGLLLEGRF